MNLTIDESHLDDFKKAVVLFNKYYDYLVKFSEINKIDPRSGFESSFLEEMNWYLFKDLPEIKNKTYSIHNKNIYLGLKFDENDKINVDKKNVDFCIASCSKIEVNNEYTIEIIKPIICVEVKTHTDATMFGEIKSSSQAIKSGTPTAKTYVLMGYNCIGKEKIINAKYDTALTEMFVLRADKNSKMEYEIFLDYWKEISNSITNYKNPKNIITPGRLLNQ